MLQNQISDDLEPRGFPLGAPLKNCGKLEESASHHVFGRSVQHTMILQWPADAKLLEVVPKGPRATREGHEKKDESRKPESTKLFVKKLKCIGLSII